jgi:hypothetical protein
MHAFNTPLNAWTWIISLWRPSRDHGCWRTDFMSGEENVTQLSSLVVLGGLNGCNPTRPLLSVRVADAWFLRCPVTWFSTEYLWPVTISCGLLRYKVGNTIISYASQNATAHNVDTWLKEEFILSYQGGKGVVVIVPMPYSRDYKYPPIISTPHL